MKIDSKSFTLSKRLNVIFMCRTFTVAQLDAFAQFSAFGDFVLGPAVTNLVLMI